MSAFLEAEGEIRQLHARFLDAAIRQDGAAFASCFTREGEWKIAGMRLRGRDELRDTFNRLLGLCERVFITLGIPLIEVGDGIASSRVNVTEFARMKAGGSALTLGVYYDRYAREDGAWLFSWRHFALHYRGPSDLSADFVDLPDYGPPPMLPDDDAPTFTRRKAD